MVRRGVAGDIALGSAAYDRDTMTTMNRYLLIVLAIVLLIAGGGYWFFLRPDSEAVPDPDVSLNLPSSETPDVGPGSRQGEGVTVVLQDGSSVVVPDFIKEDIRPTANATNGYQVSGGDTEDFQILFYPSNSGVLVSLFTEPLGPTRLAAEQALRTKFNLTNEQICLLTADVRTTYSVNELYSGRNLGFSFCPGATELP